MPEELDQAIAEIAAFAKQFEPLDGHFVVETKGQKKRGRHVRGNRRVYVPAADFDRVRKACYAGDILRLLADIKKLAQELENE